MNYILQKDILIPAPYPKIVSKGAIFQPNGKLGYAALVMYAAGEIEIPLKFIMENPLWFKPEKERVASNLIDSPLDKNAIKFAEWLNKNYISPKGYWHQRFLDSFLNAPIYTTEELYSKFKEGK